MTRLTSASVRRTVLATLLLGVIVVAVMALTVSPAPAAPGANCTYYNNASHTTVVGQFGRDCCNNPVAWGIKTKFSSCGGCFICFPPPR
jgi:hypothetical protein